MEASGARQAYLTPSKLTPGEFGGMFAALVLVASLFLPWFGTSDSNPNSVLDDGKISGGESATAFETFSTLQFLLIAAATAPFILSWIIARGHKLTWAPGEVTMVVGITALVLILCNGIILGRPGDSVDISLDIGYFVALLAALGLAFCGYLRQAVYTEGRKPPGTL
jgi:hypothetical protein